VQRGTEDRLRATQEHANIGIAEYDAQGRFLHVNSGITAITGYTRDELLGRSFFEFTDSEDAVAERL
jgi:PAS domain S-box-containing protein